MKQNLKKTALIISVVFALSGCGTANTPANETSLQNQVHQPAQDDPNAQTPPDGQGGRNSQGMKFVAADLIGEVSSISGSEITVKVINFQGMGQGRRDGFGANSDGQTTPGAFGRRQKPAAGDGRTPASDPGQSRTPANDQGQSQTPANDRGQNQTEGSNQSGSRHQSGIQYTGETKVLKITDSVEISKMVRGDSGITSQAIQISEIKVGDTLQVFYSDKSKETLSKITIGTGMGIGGGGFQRQKPDSSTKS